MKFNRLQDHPGSLVLPFLLCSFKKGAFFLFLFLIFFGPGGGTDVFSQAAFSGPGDWRAQIHLEFSPETLAREPHLDQKLQKIFSRQLPPLGAAYQLSRQDPVLAGRDYTLTLEGSGGPEQLRQMLRTAADPTLLPGDGPMILELSGNIGPGESLPLSLEANPSTGYIWEITAADPQKILVRDKGLFRAQSPLLGAAMTQTILLEGSGGGETALQVTYRRPWLKDQPAAKKARIQLSDLNLAVTSARPDPAPTLPLVEPPAAGDGDADLPSLQLAGSFDWRNMDGQNYLPPIRNQGSCGSCWAFGTVAPLEAAVKIKQGLDVDLSEQYLVSCSFDEPYDYGCVYGGWFAHQYHREKIPFGEPTAGAVKEADYPYSGTDSACTPPHAHPQKITNWSYVNPGHPYGIPAESAIKSAITAYGVVAAAVCSGPAMGGYRGGIFSTDESAFCGGSVNHAIALVGWDDAEGTWIMRNSWGPYWGESGYMRIKRNVSNIGYGANYVIYDPPPPLPQFTPTHWTYLPMILSNANNIAICQEPLCNGNFEGGPTLGWSDYSARGYEDLVLNLLADYGDYGLYNHQGDFAAWLGGDFSETAIISQRITIPASATHLGYWYWIDSVDSCNFDFAEVYFNGTLLKKYDLCFTRDTGTWAYDQIDISAYRGLTGTLSFQVTTDEDPDLISSLFLDDVVLITETGQSSLPRIAPPARSPVPSSSGGVRRKTKPGAR